uniref:DIS3-like exonuclease 2 n=1 Tax=Anthurium amnicola TaxID=1678845 RepID=A0A1D1Y3E7_9ARAE
MRGAGDQMATTAAPAFAPAPGDEADKDRRKQRRRSSRRAKQTTVCTGAGGEAGHKGFDGSGSGGAGGSGSRHPVEGDGVRVEEKLSEVAFSSLPTMRIDAAGEGLTGHGEASSSMPPALAVGGGGISKSCPLPGSFPEDRSREIFRGAQSPKGFDPHWSEDAVSQAIEKGCAFRAVLRVNAYNRLEAYCTVEGLPVDVLISGAAAQNRAVEGDVVALMLDPVASWTRLKGSVGQSSNSVSAVDSNGSSEVINVNNESEKEASFGHSYCNGNMPPFGKSYHCHEKNGVGEAILSDLGNEPTRASCLPNGQQSFTLEMLSTGCDLEDGEGKRSLRRICAMINSSPSKRPTGRVLAIIEPSGRRDAVVGFLSCKKLANGKICRKGNYGLAFSQKHSDGETVRLIPTDPRFPEMVVSVNSLPDYLKEKLRGNESTVEKELLAAQIKDWSEESPLPQAHVLHIFGQGGEIEPQIAAIFFENAISSVNFSPESLFCLPEVPWKIPFEEIERRKDLRNLCTFTIDPSRAIELDDALSVERVTEDVYRVGVHIADVSYFVQPDTALDTEAQARSTSVYILQHKLPMLPSLLSEKLVSLLPSEDKLTFSIIWEITLSGNIVGQWIGRSVIRSCCKLSYEHAQNIIDGYDSGTSIPALHGQFDWQDLKNAVRTLHKISRKLKENRFENGALWLNNVKLELLFDEFGNPYDSILRQMTESNFLVEEFMLLANKTAAEIISRTFPDSALLRRHPEPNLRKLKEFKAFCSKHGFELDTSSSGQLHLSLVNIREMLKDDPVFSDILVSYASRPMQLASYICTGDFRDREDEWAHYALGVPQYTHFTSPLRRYPDIIVHRTLLAALEAEEMYIGQRKLLVTTNNGEESNAFSNSCFTGILFDKAAAESTLGKEALNSATLKYRIPSAIELSEIVVHCNERKLASRQAEDSGEKVYMWALLRNKEAIISEARVMGLGPKFMSVYVHKLAVRN